MQFAVGNKVVFKADPDRVGVVTSVDDGGPEPRYTVFMINEEVPAYESQLALAEDVRPEVLARSRDFVESILIQHIAPAAARSLAEKNCWREQ